MAKKVSINMVCDLDNAEYDPDGGGETVTFALEGQYYEVDLCEKDATAFRRALKKYTEHGRKATAPRKTRTNNVTSTTRRDPEQVKAIKSWLVENGYEPPQRGRIPLEMLNAYEAAHAPSEATEAS